MANISGHFGNYLPASRFNGQLIAQPKCFLPLALIDQTQLGHLGR